MAKIGIPKTVVEGFIGISRLDGQQVDRFSEFLKTLPVGTKFEEIENFLTNEQAYNPQEIVKTIVSFGDLLEGKDVDYKDLSKDLANSVIKDYSDQLERAEEEKLSSNLYKIFESSANLKLTLKAYNLVMENDNLLVSSKINTDIRLIFHDDITDGGRNGVIMHKLHLVISNDGKRNSVYITMDNSDLKRMKDILDRALSKEGLIKEDYKDINFINY